MSPAGMLLEPQILGRHLLRMNEGIIQVKDQHKLLLAQDILLLILHLLCALFVMHHDRLVLQECELPVLLHLFGCEYVPAFHAYPLVDF